MNKNKDDKNNEDYEDEDYDENTRLSDEEIDELLTEAIDEERSKLRSFLDTDIALLESNAAIFTFSTDPAHMVYVQADESLVFWKVAHPLAKMLARDKSILLIDQDSQEPKIDPESQFALVCLNAGSLTADYLKKLIQGEGPLSSIFRSEKVRSLFYLHCIHRCSEVIHPHVAALVDSVENRPRARVVISGIYGQPKNSNAVNRNVTSRCAVYAIE